MVSIDGCQEVLECWIFWLQPPSRPQQHALDPSRPLTTSFPPPNLLPSFSQTRPSSGPPRFRRRFRRTGHVCALHLSLRKRRPRGHALGLPAGQGGQWSHGQEQGRSAFRCVAVHYCPVGGLPQALAFALAVAKRLVVAVACLCPSGSTMPRVSNPPRALLPVLQTPPSFASLVPKQRLASHWSVHQHRQAPESSTGATEHMCNLGEIRFCAAQPSSTKPPMFHGHPPPPPHHPKSPPSPP